MDDLSMLQTTAKAAAEDKSKCVLAGLRSRLRDFARCADVAIRSLDYDTDNEETPQYHIRHLGNSVVLTTLNGNTDKKVPLGVRHGCLTRALAERRVDRSGPSVSTRRRTLPSGTSGS